VLKRSAGRSPPALGEERCDCGRGFAARDPFRIGQGGSSEEGEPMTVSESNGPGVVDASMLAERLGRHEPVTLLDVRRPERWLSGDGHEGYDSANANC
jgi:hypothetical protein